MVDVFDIGMNIMSIEMDQESKLNISTRVLDILKEFNEQTYPDKKEKIAVTKLVNSYIRRYGQDDWTTYIKQPFLEYKESLEGQE